MQTIDKPKFIYVTYIRSTPEQVWRALTDPEINRICWNGVHLSSDWKVGSPWSMVRPNGETSDSGEILESNPPRRLVLRWRNEFRPELAAEGWSRCSFDIESVESVVKLTITHAIEGEGTKFIAAVSGGWPQIVSNIKSFLETGNVVLTTPLCEKE